MLAYLAFARGGLQTYSIKDTGPSKGKALCLELLKTFHFKLIAGFPVGTESSKYTFKMNLLIVFYLKWLTLFPQDPVFEVS